VSKVKAELEAVGCPLCKKSVVEVGPRTAVTCVCPCGAFLLITRDRDGEIVRREVLDAR
jgi:hypothetical protein